MPSDSFDSTKSVLHDYHDASHRLQARHAEAGQGRGESGKWLTSGARELMSRCILSGDPRSVVFLLREISILLRVLGQSEEAGKLEASAQKLARHYLEHGSF